MKYRIDGNGWSFPIEIYFDKYSVEDKIGFIEVYRTGKIYSNLFNAGMSIKEMRKILKIANRERIKLIIKQKLFIR